MKWTVTNVNFWKTAPFAIDLSTGQTVLVSSKYRFGLQFLNLFVQCLYVGFLAFRTISMYSDESVGMQQRILMEYFLGISLMPVLYQVNAIVRRDDFLHFINEYPATLRQIWSE